MIKTLAFDVYGTLIDTQGITATLVEILGVGSEQSATVFAHSWRDKQLEYSFRRGLMQQYETFAVCTAQSLDYTCEALQIALTKAQKQQLLNAYKTLPTFAEVQQSLQDLSELGIDLYAFSNGAHSAVNDLLLSGGIADYFIDIISVDEIKTFKPNPRVYQHFLHRTGAKTEHTCLVSSNSFDLIGAHSMGWQTAWIKRNKLTTFDPWGLDPSVTIGDLLALQHHIKAVNKIVDD